MDDKKNISLELHNELSAQMDELCDRNDFDGIIQLCHQLQIYTHAKPLIRLHLFYNIGSGYSHVASRIESKFDSTNSGLALLNFRKAMAEVKKFARDTINSITSDEVMSSFYDLRSRLLTNMASELDYQGRRLEALAYYEDPIKSGNVHAVLSKARCLFFLAQSVYDDGHAYYLQRESAECYREALSRINEFPAIQRNSILSNSFHEHFIEWFKEQESKYGSEFPPLSTLSGNTSSAVKKEKEYFRWCAKNKLFINELNAISTSEVVDHDVLTLPSFTTRNNRLLTSSEELSFHGHFDEMKTDYCYARYLAFLNSSISLFDDHFFNSTFDHVDTLDYEINNLKTNHLKSCFRISYSIFDKISFFLHRFFELDAVQNDHKVDFKKIWFKPGSKKLKDIFQESDNSHFRALYFISHEIRQAGGKAPDDKDLSYWFDPDTDRLFKIRNAMEHRAFKLVDAVCHHNLEGDSTKVEEYRKELQETQLNIEKISKQLQSSSNNDLENQLQLLKQQEANFQEDIVEYESMSSYFVVIGVEEFEALTMKLLTLAKDALIYLSLAIHHEGLKRPNDGGFISTNIVPRR
ncbi:hypothetical protein A8139_14915 [Marinomonas primoryensis]|uniref:LA2681-like HEPN domain-containing protein n=1 Tax=Marinomonas primoryensis TaxID=178399 RepID=A0A2Z4PU37_9GAMM|nr:LA2681 family HEPN domain-containing protein [Marinomonas primoryensis]AWY01122.1 hypothetical protein A8139_14915 [Marinomonas primoryensis]